MAYIVDSNILIRVTEKGHPQRPVALEALTTLRRSYRLYFTPQILAEFWSVCTRPPEARGGLGLSTKEVDLKARLLQKHFELLPDSVATFNEWRRLVVDLEISGVKVHDAKIVASMLIHSVPRLLTFNVRDFKRFTTITAVDPRDV